MFANDKVEIMKKVQLSKVAELYYNLKNKEVILPSLSFVSTAHAVMYNGGKPIFADVDTTPVQSSVKAPLP